ncbi:MAG: TetR/AcrR family transcriptional regulator [Clostridiales bacterium]|nr:TetR/AcrR family transcriptional regulator [Clostridiales bacterium]MDD6389089.1 TetR/AcrR family transcriptional regulator [Bacillota bacterium]
MRPVNKEARRAKQIEIMEGCFDCYAKNGLAGVGVKAISEACGCNVASIYQYFENLDDLIIQSTEYCMSKVEDDFMAKAPTDVDDLWRFIEEIPYWTARKHGAKYRLMYQVYTHPKYREYGQKFFKGVDERYTEYARSLEDKIGIPYQKLTPLIFIMVRACVHYALFEDEFYLKSQIEVLKETLVLFIEKYSGEKI